MEVRFDTDSDGFLSQECPSCQQGFKVVFGTGSDKPISFCPYCCHNGHDCWWTPKQIDYIRSAATEVVVRPELEKLQRQLKSMSNEIFEIKMTSDVPDPMAPPVETDDPLEVVHFQCCEETIKVLRGNKYYCIICGGQADMAIGDSKRIFLSHKGSDKDMVIEFKNTLEALGYDPWLDEEAMPAGVSVEHALLQGMEDSCAVVFFITPSFKDEGYLETEINYAILEKREKGDQFSIITLLFKHAEHDSVQVPKLLTPYVWKTPKTELQALIEIIRALPITLGKPDWKEQPTDVIETLTDPPVTSGLSEEAKAILLEAAKTNGMIYFPHNRRHRLIQAGGKQMNQDDEPRTIARWKGGLEELQRHRYIEGMGHKGETFEVTDEGYGAADALLVE